MICDVCGNPCEGFCMVMVSELITEKELVDSFCSQRELKVCESCIKELNFKKNEN